MLVLGGPIGTSVGIWRHQVPVLSRHFRVLRFETPGPVTDALLRHSLRNQ